MRLGNLMLKGIRNMRSEPENIPSMHPKRHSGLSVLSSREPGRFQNGMHRKVSPHGFLLMRLLYFKEMDERMFSSYKSLLILF